MFQTMFQALDDICVRQRETGVLNLAADLQFLITGLGFRSGASSDRQLDDSHHAHPACGRKSDKVTASYRRMGSLDAAAVQAHMPVLRHFLGDGAALGEAREPQELVYPQAWPVAALPTRLSHCGPAGRQARRRHDYRPMPRPRSPQGGEVMSGQVRPAACRGRDAAAPPEPSAVP